MTQLNSDEGRTGRGFRFNLRRLLLITTLVAVVTAAAWRLNWPEAARGSLAVYLLFMLFWLAIVLPNDLREFRRQKRRLAQRRAELARRYGESGSPRSERGAKDDGP